MAVNANVLGDNNLSVVFEDGTGTPVTLTLTNDLEVSVTGLTGGKLNSVEKITRRGGLFAVASGERIFPQVTITFIHTGFKGATAAPGTALEFATFQGLYSANISTYAGGTKSEKAITIKIMGEMSDYGGADAALTLKHCFLVAHDLLTPGTPNNTFSLTFDVCGDVDADLDYVAVN